MITIPIMHRYQARIHFITFKLTDMPKQAGVTPKYAQYILKLNVLDPNPPV